MLGGAYADWKRSLLHDRYGCRMVNGGGKMDKSERNVLIIWEEVPEIATLYLVPESVYNDEFAAADHAHGVFLNTTEKRTRKQKAALELLSAAAGDPEYAQHYSLPERVGDLAPYRVDDSGGPLCATIVKVICSGIML